MAAQHHRLHPTRTARVPAGLLLACLLAAPAFAQDAAGPQPVTPAAVEAAPPAPAATPTRKRGGFGEAMSRLTQALRDASQAPAAATPSATPAAATTQAAPAVEPGALAVESPP